MHTSYEAIYENLLPKFQDYDIPIMTEDEVKEYLHDFLVPAIARFHVCRKDLNDRDDLLERFNVELSVMELEILSNFCLIEYLDSKYVRTPSLLKVSLSSKDFNAFSPANHLDKLLSMRKAYESENASLLMKYAWMGARETKPSWSKGYKKKSEVVKDN